MPPGSVLFDLMTILLSQRSETRWVDSHHFPLTFCSSTSLGIHSQGVDTWLGIYASSGFAYSGYIRVPFANPYLFLKTKRDKPDIHIMQMYRHVELFGSHSPCKKIQFTFEYS